MGTDQGNIVQRVCDAVEDITGLCEMHTSTDVLSGRNIILNSGMCTPGHAPQTRITPCL